MQYNILTINYYVAVVYTVEFQKRGLPHAHILIWVHVNSKYPTPESIDEIISAEIPDKETDPIGYAAVGQFMMHGPCGKASPRSPCMKGGQCTKYFPKTYNENTIIDESGFPIYRRRLDEGKWIEKNGNKLDNSYVVPYNRKLLVRYQAHINVEWCNRGRSIKYLFKYITKGPDYASIAIQTVNSQIQSTSKGPAIDEIQYYLQFRYVSALEAIWRIYGFDIHYRVPAVERLRFHLLDQQSVIYKDTITYNK